MRLPIAVVVLGVLLALPLAQAAAQEPDDSGRDPAFEQEILDRLALISPEAVPVFLEATAATDAGRLEDARRGFLRVLELVPEFPDALRRLAAAEVYLGQYAEAVAHAERALELQPSVWNKSVLAMALASSNSPAEHRRGLDLALEASREEPEDPTVAFTLAVAAASTEDMPALRTAAERLLRLAPQDPAGHYFAGLLAAADGRWEESERELLMARDLGAEAEDIDRLLDAGVATQAARQRWSRRAAFAVVGWAGGLLALFGVGSILSRMTLGAVGRRSGAAGHPVPQQERFVRTIYRVVIGLTSIYFYISIPVLIVLVVAVVAGVIYVFLEIGAMPLQFVGFLVFGAIITLLAIVRSLLTRLREVEPGRPLLKDEAPALWRLTDEVARRVATRPLEAIYIGPGTGISVLERGRTTARMRGRGSRSLLLGLGSLAGMTQRQLRAVLAHEYGHFAHGDTAGGDMALRVDASLQRLAYGLAASGQARWYNPAWLFVMAFHRIFLRITLGASRLQEILADRMAAMAYGAEAFADGLRHIVLREIVFAAAANEEIETAGRERRALRNLYVLSPSSEDPSDLEKRLNEAMNRPTTPYDSHPAPRARLDLLTGILQGSFAMRGEPPRPSDDDPVSDLIPTLEALQREMTALVASRVAGPPAEAAP